MSKVNGWNFSDLKHFILSEKFKNVKVLTRFKGKETPYYLADITINYRRMRALYDNEREAAAAVDRALINAGKAPINVLKKIEK